MSKPFVDLTPISVSNQDIEIQFRCSITTASNKYSADIDAGLDRAEREIKATSCRIDELDQDIDRLTSHADQTDNLVAVASGLLAGLVDVFWVGEFNFQRGKAWSNRTVNDFVMKTAKSQGYEGDRLDGAIKHLEKKFPVPNDNIWKGKNVGVSAKSHHLDDLAHHPTPIGLFFSILTQFTKKGYFQNSDGTFLPIALDEQGLELIGQTFQPRYSAAR